MPKSIQNSRELIALYREQLKDLDKIQSEHSSDSFLGYFFTGFLQTVKGTADGALNAVSLGNPAVKNVNDVKGVVGSFAKAKQSYDSGNTTEAFSHYLAGAGKLGKEKEISFVGSLATIFENDDSLKEKALDVVKATASYNGDEAISTGLGLRENLQEIQEGLGNMETYGEVKAEFASMVDKRKAELEQLIAEEETNIQNFEGRESTPTTSASAYGGNNRFDGYLTSIRDAVVQLQDNTSAS